MLQGLAADERADGKGPDLPQQGLRLMRFEFAVEAVIKEHVQVQVCSVDREANDCRIHDGSRALHVATGCYIPHRQRTQRA